MALDSTLERLRASVLDGKAQNPKFKQQQLHLLHAELTTQADEICATIAADSHNSSAEVETEFYLTVNAIRHFYESIDCDQDLKEDNLVTKSIDNTSRRVAAGLVVIRPTTYTRLFSIIVPIAAAIAAGNCIILELEDNTFALDDGLKESLPDTLDKDTFAIVKTAVSEEDLASCILVDQRDTPSLSAQLASNLDARTIAVIDRAVDIDAAAKAVVLARFSFQGMSPYAPDIVVVNEFIKNDFFQACARYAAQSFTSNPPASRSQDHPSRVAQKAIKDAEDKGQLSSIGSSKFTIVDISERSCPVINMKIRGRYLPIMSYSSLTDVVSSQTQKSTFLAGYFFGDATTGKLLSDKLDCHISCINQLPVHLLVGPAAPISHPPAFQHRYSEEMFSVSRPQYVQMQAASLILGLALAAGGSKGLDSYTGASVTGSSIRKLSMAPLRPPKKSSTSLFGFFEQGLMSGVATALVVAAGVGYAVWIYVWTSAQVAELEG